MLFKILHGDESNISTDITPFHEGWAYMTHSGNFYCDLNIGTVETPNNQRIKLNAANAETLAGMSLDEIKAYIDAEIENVNLSIPNEIYIGDGDMPEGATIQLIMDAVDEEELLKNEITEYIDSQIARAKAEIKSYVDDVILNGEW